MPNLISRCQYNDCRKFARNLCVKTLHNKDLVRMGQVFVNNLCQAIFRFLFSLLITLSYNLLLFIFWCGSVAVELHRVVGTSAGEVTQCGSVAEHLHERDEGIEFL